MKIQPEVQALDIAVIPAASSPFVAVPRADGLVARCRFCSAEVALCGGFADARDVRHAPGCRIAPALASVRKQLVIRHPIADSGVPS